MKQVEFLLKSQISIENRDIGGIGFFPSKFILGDQIFLSMYSIIYLLMLGSGSKAMNKIESMLSGS